jgi:hypothetical protein
MAIDPMLYETLSGRKGDPHARLGEALAKGDRGPKKQHYGDAPEESPYLGYGLLGFYGYGRWVWGSAGGGLLVLGVIVWALLKR